MAEAPKLSDLCLAAIADEVLRGDGDNDILSVAYELPSELFRSLLPLLAPLALQKLHENLPFDFVNDFECANYNYSDCRKRKRYWVLDTAWRDLCKRRWPDCIKQKRIIDWLDKHDEAKNNFVDDWQQLYWETHLQDCMDSVAETASLPSYDGSIREIQIPDAILERIGCKGHQIKLSCDYLKFCDHCLEFGVYARYLRIPSALCVTETCDLLRSSKLENLELQWIKSNDHVEALCKLLNQNSATLKSIYFIHCKLSPLFINMICDSLCMEGVQTHGIEHFSIKRSSFLQNDSYPVPVKLTSFVTSGRSLRSLTFCDDQLGRNFARKIFNSLFDASPSISMLDLSENDISGFLSHFLWRLPECSPGIGKSLQSLQALNLRCCNLERDDVDYLNKALCYMPNLQNLDLSDNSVGDGIWSLISYFTEISGRSLPFIDLKLESCELTCSQVVKLLEALSTMKKPLNVLSIKGNRLGSDIGAPLGRFLSTGICALDVEDIGLGSSGFLAALSELSKDLKLSYINISNNQGGIEAAKFVSNLISHSHKIVAIDARYNLMPMESLSQLCLALRASKGKLEHLDLAGNSFCNEADAAFLSAEFQLHGHAVVNVSLLAAPNAPYDDDP